MFCALNEKKDIVAIHDCKKIIEKYIFNIHRTNPQEILTIGKIKDKNLKTINGLDDLYLVRFHSTYIQEKYVDYLRLVYDEYIEDYIYTRDILKRIVEVEDVCDKKDLKAIMRAIDIMEDLIDDEEKYTPDISKLKELESTFEPYINMWK